MRYDCPLHTAVLIAHVYSAVLIQAAFSYIGTEITAIAAGEAKNPKRNLPRAIKKVYFRIIVFYILGTFVIGLIASPDDPALNLSTSTAAKSPWVTAVVSAGIDVLPSVINAAFLGKSAHAIKRCTMHSADVHTQLLLGPLPALTCTPALGKLNTKRDKQRLALLMVVLL